MSTGPSNFKVQDLNHKTNWTYFLKFLKNVTHWQSLYQKPLYFILEKCWTWATKNYLSNYLFRSTSPDSYVLLFFFSFKYRCTPSWNSSSTAVLDSFCTCYMLLNIRNLGGHMKGFFLHQSQIILTVGVQLGTGLTLSCDLYLFLDFCWQFLPFLAANNTLLYTTSHNLLSLPVPYDRSHYNKRIYSALIKINLMLRSNVGSTPVKVQWYTCQPCHNSQETPIWLKRKVCKQLITIQSKGILEKEVNMEDGTINSSWGVTRVGFTEVWTYELDFEWWVDLCSSEKASWEDCRERNLSGKKNMGKVMVAWHFWL